VLNVCMYTVAKRLALDNADATDYSPHCRWLCARTLTKSGDTGTYNPPPPPPHPLGLYGRVMDPAGVCRRGCGAPSRSPWGGQLEADPISHAVSRLRLLPVVLSQLDTLFAGIC
jgi:hypothetical protein